MKSHKFPIITNEERGLCTKVFVALHSRLVAQRPCWDRASLGCGSPALAGPQPSQERRRARAVGERAGLPSTPPPSRWRWRPCRRRHRLSPGQTGAAPAASRAAGPPPSRRGRGLPAPGSGGRGAEPSGRRSPERQCAAAGGCDLSAAARSGPLNGGALRRRLRAWRGGGRGDAFQAPAETDLYLPVPQVWALRLFRGRRCHHRLRLPVRRGE